ncbi:MULTISPECIES: hypothetical protein [Synechococcales]|uniref:hypothetical protein n=1 Tax=unclassified Synechococcus TaxID=2626047 RepID=UPI000DB23E74|nr:MULTISPECIES: hypothetical protein [unclassified Synechococcus]MCT0212057.1 hypothetical protein [Synechococcus sp. CS-1326]MCT0234177.1 hypothetical protein [Synechococcus sp. CS-1327]PZU97523.1 MAG: hypothetical protein DCF24_12280 [Cyanobium sp.]PZV02384.1 MAG: hypothetical protein DCF23_11760 [Cyanobium sp.]
MNSQLPKGVINGPQKGSELNKTGQIKPSSGRNGSAISRFQQEISSPPGKLALQEGFSANS